MATSTKRTKQTVMDEVCDLLGVRRFEVGKGSTEPQDFFVEIARALGIKLPDTGTKPELARYIAGMGGLTWDSSCDSSTSQSGGGSTVTLVGLERVLEAAIAISSGRVSVDGEFEFDARPDATALVIFQHMKFSEWYALGEFIDNSITSAQSNLDLLRSVNGDDYQLRVTIDIDDNSDDPAILVRDNAAGISRANIASAMRTGSLPINAAKGLSVHGVGMKAAAFWWGSRLEVTTHPIGESNGWRMVIDLDEIRASQHGVGKAVQIPHRGYPGTEIRISKLHKGPPRTRTVSTIRRYLPSIYRQFLDTDLPTSGGVPDSSRTRLELRYQGSPLSYTRPDLLTEPFWPSAKGPEKGGEAILWRKEISINVETNSGLKRVTGWVGLLKTMSRDLSGFFLHFRGKGIAGVVPDSDGEGIEDFVSRGAYKPRSIFGQSGHYVDQRLVGEIDISEFGKTITTDDVVWSPAEEQDFLGKLLLELQSPDFVRQAKNYRANARTGPSKKEQDKIVKEETEALANGIRDSNIAHGEADLPEGGQGAKTVGPEDFEGRDASGVHEFMVSDSANHVHQFKLRILHDRSHVFLDVCERDHEHLIALNENHPVLDGLGPIDGQLEQLLIRLALGLASSEVFLGGPDKREVRNKLNEMLAKISFSEEP